MRNQTYKKLVFLLIPDAKNDISTEIVTFLNLGSSLDFSNEVFQNGSEQWKHFAEMKAESFC